MIKYSDLELALPAIDKMIKYYSEICNDCVHETCDYCTTWDARMIPCILCEAVDEIDVQLAGEIQDGCGNCPWWVIEKARTKDTCTPRLLREGVVGAIARLKRWRKSIKQSIKRRG